MPVFSGPDLTDSDRSIAGLFFLFWFLFLYMPCTLMFADIVPIWKLIMNAF